MTSVGGAAVERRLREGSWMADGPRAVVIGLASVTGLQTARLLAERGVDVIGIAGDRRHFAARTRVCEQVLEADVHGDGFLDALETIGPGLAERAVLYPCTDQAVLVVSAHRTRLSRWYHVVLPPDGVVQSLTRKATFYACAQQLGLTVPASFTLHSRADAERAAEALPYPSVLKPSVKSGSWKSKGGVKALQVSTPGELLAAYDRLAPWTEAMVAQQYVGGGDDRLYTCNCYYDGGHQPLVTFVTRKRRQWPPHVGTASLAQEFRNDEVVAQTLRLFGAVAFRGLGYLEMKQDVVTGQHYVMEANIGRPTGRSATAEAGGVELLYTMYCEAVGLPLPTAREQRFVGATWIDLRRDLLSAVHYWRRGELTAADWYRSVRGRKVHAVLSARDPLPFVFEVGQSARKAVRRFVQRIPSRVAPPPADV